MHDKMNRDSDTGIFIVMLYRVSLNINKTIIRESERERERVIERERECQSVNVFYNSIPPYNIIYIYCR